MKKLLLLALFAGSAHAATYYRDRPMPFTAGPVCMIELVPGVNVNVHMIISIELNGNKQVYEKDLNNKNWVGGNGEWVNKPAVVVSVAPTTTWSWTGDEADRKARFQRIMDRIEACK